MKVLGSLEELEAVTRPLSIAIGFFDGVHRGHRALISRAMESAAAHDGAAVVLTFHPHPAKVLRPDKAPRLLTSSAHKQRLIRSLGVPCMVELEFNRAFAEQPPDRFIRSLHRHAPSLREICVGHQWAFGKGRSGNVALLRRLGNELGFAVTEIPPVLHGDESVSSTRIRHAVENGALDVAAELLGRPYTILGTVERGAGLGHKLGFPTANLAAHNEQFPPDGVYAIAADVAGNRIGGVANIGVRPTVSSEQRRILEIHLLDFQGDLYGQDIEVEFQRFLRPEQRFNNVKELRSRIAIDVEEARRLWAGEH